MKIALIGYGKMGRAIEEVAVAAGHEIVLRISSGSQTELTDRNISKADVAIEFTQPGTALKHILFCVKNHIPVVSGTTGWLHDIQKVEKAVNMREGSFLYASNFSIGVNMFFALNRKLAELMCSRPEYDVRIIETHHIHKKDAPSGTAITLAEGIIDTGKKTGFTSGGRADEDKLLITSIREGEVPGTHRVIYSSENDQIDIIHTAHNRKGFAAGAVAAAAYICNRKGVFTMKDVLGL